MKITWNFSVFKEQHPVGIPWFCLILQLENNTTNCIKAVEILVAVSVIIFPEENSE